MFLPVIFGMHVWHIGWCVAAGSFFWTAILLWKKRNIYEEQVTEMTNSVIAIEDETLRCYLSPAGYIFRILRTLC